MFPRHQNFRPAFPRRSRGALGRAAGVLLCLCAAGAWVGCSVERNYKVLTFFFDGVPDPNAPKPAADSPAGLQLDIRQSPSYSIHRPYADDQCSECHADRQVRIGGRDSTVCLKCHKETLPVHAVTHGPVDANACLWCHVPHESAYAVLFKAPARDVCSQCHTPEMLVSARVPEHADAGRSCLECHFGHGGEQRYFLKPSAPRPGSPAPRSQEKPGGV